MAGDAGGLLDQRAPLVGLERQRLVDQALSDYRVGAFGEARLAEQIGDVAQSNAGAVEIILVLARAVGATGNDHLAVIHRQPAVGVVEHQARLGHAQPGALVGAAEDHVLRAFGAQPAVGLLAQDPLDGVGDVGLAAAVGTDDGGQPALEQKVGLDGEGFVALEFELF